MDISSHAVFLYRAFNSINPRSVNFSYAVPQRRLFRKIFYLASAGFFASASVSRTYCKPVRAWITHIKDICERAATSCKRRPPRHRGNYHTTADPARNNIANIRASVSAKILAAPHRHIRRTSVSSHLSPPLPRFQPITLYACKIFPPSACRE